MNDAPSSHEEFSDRDQRLAVLLGRLADCVHRGQPVDIQQQCRENPDVADELLALWGTIVVADAAGGHPAHDSPPPLDPSSPTLELPCRFGEYVLEEELGRGGMGVVYRARQLGLNRDVAVKMILRGQLASTADRDRFQAEAEAAAKLDHPGIVPVYDVGQQDAHSYFSMKYVQGHTLARRLADGPMQAREIASLLSKVCRALHYAHRHGVLHRDIKPSNILIDSGDEPHIMDFGLAKVVRDGASLTRTGAVLGTPAYIAPEQAAGDRGQAGPVSDVYSLGSVLYHMLTGRPPFQAANPVDAVLMVLEQEPLPPRMLQPKVDRDLEMIALRCLQKPSDLRYDSAAALADDLDAYLNGEPISARSGRLSQVVTRMLRETHHADVLENWGLLWMWHSLVLLAACSLTNIMVLLGIQRHLDYILVWTLGLGSWAVVFWWLRQRMGPVTFVERQIAHVWGASMVASGMLFVVEILLGLDVLTLSPVLALFSGMVFMTKAGILSGTFYVQAACLFLTSIAMALLPQCAHFLFGVVSAACFFIPGLKYFRQREKRD